MESIKLGFVYIQLICMHTQSLASKPHVSHRTQSNFDYTVEPLYNEVLGTMKITLLYQVSHYIRVKKQRNIKSWDQQNYLVIRGFCYIRPLYNEVPLYCYFDHINIITNVDWTGVINYSSHLLVPRE